MQDATGKWVFDVVEEEFSQRVLEASKERPVAVDFWAPWCGPCRVLGPVLERLAEEFHGAFLLARVNTEDAPRLAQEFQVQSIPLVVLFRKGKPADQFLGLLPETEIRSFFRSHCPTEADQLLKLGKERLQEKDWEKASQYFQDALTSEPSHSGALLGLAQIAWAGRDLEKMHHYAEAIDPLSPEKEAAAELKAQAEFYRLSDQYGGLQSARRRVQDGPDDLEARYHLACCFAAEERYQEALEAFLGIVTADRSFKDEAARKAMLEIFNIVGLRSALADDYRTRLARVIF